MTRSGVRVLLDQAAGIVIDLLVALSLIALATASALLAASARAEVQRRLAAIGVRRAVGASRGHLATIQALEALFVAAPAATVGAVAGTLATYGPSGRLLVMLNEPAPGAALLPGLIAAWAAAVAIPVLAAAWPAWRAAGRPPVSLLRGAELTTSGRARGGRRRGAFRAGLTVLGVRLAAARRVRLLSTAATLGFSAAFVLLMLALASALSSLETDPGALGKRYQLTANLPASSAAHVRAIRGVQAAAPRYETEAVDSFSLGETIDVVAYPGNHTIFEAPPLVSGRRLRGTGEAEVGLGLAQALGLDPGSTLAIELDNGRELRLRVAGVVSSLDHDGRIAYVPAAALLAADPSAADSEQLSIRLKPGANAAAVSAALGPSAAPATGAVGRGVPLVSVLRSILRAVAIVDGLVCLYALIQACALTVQERRRTVSVLRAFGAGSTAVGRLLVGAVVALVVPGRRARDRARAAGARAGAGPPGRELRVAVARRQRRRDRGGGGRAATGRAGGGRLGDPAGHPRERDRGTAGAVMLTRREAIVLRCRRVARRRLRCERLGRGAATGSTLASTWSDPGGTGTLRPAPGEPLIDAHRARAAPER